MNSINQKIYEPTPNKGFKKAWLVFILGSLTAFGPLSMDMYLPALPVVTTDLHTSASLAQLSITSCLLGLALGQLIFGPLSDIQGRKRPLLTTLSVYTVVSLLAAFSHHIWIFIVLRFIQGISAAAGIVIARASAKDLFDGKELTKFIALLALVNGAAPILAPLFGGVILNWISWRAVFYVLALVGLIMLAGVLLTLKETLPEEKRSKGGMLATVQTFGILLKDRTFMGIALTQAFISMCMFAYIAGSPFVLQNIYNISAQQFSLVFAINGVGIILAAQLTGKLAPIIDEIKLLRTGVMISFTGSCLLLIVVLFHLPLWVMLPALFLVVSSVGMVNTTSFSLGMQRQGKIAGSASAFLGILPFGGGGLVSPLVGIGGDATAIPMGVTIFACSLIGIILFKIMIKDTSLTSSISEA